MSQNRGPIGGELAHVDLDERCEEAIWGGWGL